MTLDVDLHAVFEGFDSASKPSPAHHQIVEHYASPLLLGPPPSEILLELVVHMFTEEEAELVAHLPPLRARTAESVARRAGRPVREVERVLDRLASTKMIILAVGPVQPREHQHTTEEVKTNGQKNEPRKYSILPIVPGTFEAALMTTDLSTRNGWHKKFASIFEKLWDTGFVKDYLQGRPPLRVLPVARASSLFMAWPSDKLEEFVEPYDLFAVGQCQCRMAMRLVGKGCDRPLENCVAIGPLASIVIDRGMMRKADRKEILEVKHHAEEHGCVSWMVNEMGDKRGNVSCSCCGCCCHALRSITEFNAPGIVSTPHFIPSKLDEKCTSCGRCASVCPTVAWSVTDSDPVDSDLPQASASSTKPSLRPKPVFNKARCIGCGLCAVHCNAKALELKPVETCRPPETGWLPLLLKLAPSYAKGVGNVWIRRLMSP